MKHSQLWYVCAAQIDPDGKFIGSVIYEELGSDAVKLSFISSTIRAAEEE